MKLPKIVDDLILGFEKLPGIGHKSAERLAFYLLRLPQRDLEMFGQAITLVKKKTVFCKICHNLAEQDVCTVCSDSGRDAGLVFVVESFQDLLTIEKMGSYKGVYHVLHGCLSPLNNIGPEELFIDTLVKRVTNSTIKEVIIGTNTSLEGEATALYVAQVVKKANPDVSVTRLGRGMPTGVELEFADDETIKNALQSRNKV